MPVRFDQGMNTYSDNTPQASISVIGAGAMGGAIARALGRAERHVTIANSRGPESLADFAGDLSEFLHPATIVEAVAADIVILTVPWRAVPGVLESAPAWGDRILVDATNAVDFLAPDSPDATDPANPLGGMGLKAIDLDGRASSGIVVELAPGARVVKTFNHIEPELLASPATTHGQGVVFLAGDDASARAHVSGIIERLGLFAVDLGDLQTGGALLAFPGGSLLGLDLVKP